MCDEQCSRAGLPTVVSRGKGDDLATRFGLWLIKHWEADLAVAGKTSAAAAAFAAARHRRRCWDGAMIHTSVFLSRLCC